jgi:5'-nucleotidase
VALEYSRYNNHGTLFWQDGPYRSSDHDPLKVGLSARKSAPTMIDILTINDFHGRIEAGSQGEAGAAVLAGAVAAKKAKNPNTILVSAGDNIGASTFTSLIQQDSPTIDALKASGLEVSAVGNHEFDRGFDDLKGRVLPRFGGNTDVERDAGADRRLALRARRQRVPEGHEDAGAPEYAVKTIDGVRVAFIGTVTTDTARMVDPQGIKDIDFGDQLEAANRVADKISNGDLADVTVLLTHSGRRCRTSAMRSPPTRRTSAPSSAGIQPHRRHRLRAHAPDIRVQRAGGLQRKAATRHPGGGVRQGARPALAAVRHRRSRAGVGDRIDAGARQGLPADAAVASMVAAFTAQASTIGSKPVGAITADILRGGTSGSDRGVESTMGNTVADIYLWATSTNPAYAGTKAQIALMNPGGLRADLRTGDGTVTFKELPTCSRSRTRSSR